MGPRYANTIFEENDALNVMAQQCVNTTYEKVAVSNAMVMKYVFIKIINTVACNDMATTYANTKKYAINA
jgi:hypothetical protein